MGIGEQEEYRLPLLSIAKKKDLKFPSEVVKIDFKITIEPLRLKPAAKKQVFGKQSTDSG